MGKVGKSFSKGFKSITKGFSGLTKSIGKAIGSIAKISTKIVGGALNVVGLHSLSKEVERWGEDLNQVVNVLSGEYHDRAKKVQEYGEKVEDAQKSYNAGVDNLVEKMESLIAFHEIFQLAMGNRLDKYMGQYGPVLEAMMKEYQAMVRKLKEDFDFVLGLTEGGFLQRIVGSSIMIIGGLMSDMGDIISGKADGATWKRVVTTTLLVIAIVGLFFIPGLQGVALAIAVTLSAIAAFMTLDGMYANGAATGAIMGTLDFLFNDVLNLDDLVGSDFDKFDKDHEDYQQMVMFTQLAFALAGVATAWANAPVQAIATSVTEMVSTEAGFVAAESAAGQAALGVTAETSSYLGGALQVGNTISQSSFLGVSFSTYSDIYKAFSTASDIKDVAAANDQYEKMKAKFQEDIDKLNTAIDDKYRKNFIKHYKDTAYFLQDQQEYIDRYIWGMTAENMYVDPYGTTPVANIRFTPDKNTRGTSFGFEDVFDEGKMAGSKSYFNNIIYGD